MGDPKKTLLMISYPFPPNVSAGAVRSERFARYLPEFGWAVDVVTVKPKSDLLKYEKWSKALGTDSKIHFTKTLDPWLWLKKKKTSIFFLRVLRSAFMRLFNFPDHMIFWIPFAVRGGLEVCKKRGIDVIYTTSPPYSSHLSGAILKRILKKPWVVDYRDPWSFRPWFYRERWRLLRWLERKLDSMVMKNADLILTNTEKSRAQLLKVFTDISETKVACITNGWEEFRGVAEYDFANKEFVILHSGTFYGRFEPYALLYALSRWQKGLQPKDVPPMKNVSVVLLGSTDSETKRIVSSLSLENVVHILPWVSIEEAKEAMGRAHLLWTSLGTSEEASMSLPSKVFEYIAARRPIIAFFPEGDATTLIRNSGTGIVFTCTDLDEVIRVIYLGTVDRENGSIPCDRPDNKVINEFKIDRIVKKLACYLEHVYNNKIAAPSVVDECEVKPRVFRSC